MSADVSCGGTDAAAGRTVDVGCVVTSAAKANGEVADSATVARLAEGGVTGCCSSVGCDV
jgi:hypothetical protein